MSVIQLSVMSICIARPRKSTVDRLPMGDAGDPQDMGIGVNPEDDPVDPPAGGAGAGELALQRLAQPERVGGQRPGDELDDRRCHLRWELVERAHGPGTEERTGRLVRLSLRRQLELRPDLVPAGHQFWAIE